MNSPCLILVLSIIFANFMSKNIAKYIYLVNRPLKLCVLIKYLALTRKAKDTVAARIGLVAKMRPLQPHAGQPPLQWFGGKMLRRVRNCLSYC